MYANTLLEDFLLSLDKFGEELPDSNFTERTRIAKQAIKDTEEKYASEISALPFIGDMHHARTSGATVYPANITRPYDPNEK